MPTASEDLAIKEITTTSTFLRQMAILLAQAIRTEKKQNYQEEHLKGTKAILKHIHRGKGVKYQVVPKEDVALFEKILKHKRVPYVQITTPTKEAVFLTKDTDSKLVEQAWELLATELKIGLKEQALQQFLNENAGETICQITGYSEVELEVFRREVTKQGFHYAVIENEKQSGTYDILYSECDSKEATKTLKAVAYELSGEEGAMLRSQIQHALSIKASILNSAKEQPKQIQYLVNLHNPMQFITLQDGSMIQHHLVIEEKQGLDGQLHKIVKDKSQKTYPFGNRELTLAMKSYGDCVVVPKEQRSFIRGYDSVGNAMIPDETALEKELVNWNFHVKEQNYPIYSASITRNFSSEKEKLCTLSHIETEQLLQVTKELEKEGIFYISVGEDLAFKEQDKALIDKILSQTLYKGMSYLERFQAMLYYEDRGPTERTLNYLTEPIYIISAVNPDYVLKLDSTGYALLQHGEVVMSLGREEPKFEEQLERMLDKMEDIAVLSQKEVEDLPIEERIQRIEQRASIKENEASKQQEHSYEERKNHFITCDFDSMSQEEKELMKQYHSHKTKTFVVDHFVEKRMIDKMLREKMKDFSKGTKNIHPNR